MLPVPKDADKMPRLTMTGLAKYMASEDAAKRENLLYDYKFPDPEGKAQGDYYNWAKGAIRDYHQSGNDRSVLDREMLDMQQKMLGANQQAQIKLENNLRVLTSYRSFFGERKYVPVEHNPIKVQVEGVEVRLRPHLIATEGKNTRVIQYAYHKNGATKEELQFSKQLLLFYAEEAKIEVRPCDCLLLEISTGQIHVASSASKQFQAKLKAALREVRRTWIELGTV